MGKDEQFITSKKVNPKSSALQLSLIAVARSIAETAQPVVVTGDLNDVAWSATTRLFRKISGLFDPRVGRDMFNTFHADYPFSIDLLPVTNA